MMNIDDVVVAILQSVFYGIPEGMRRLAKRIEHARECVVLLSGLEGEIKSMKERTEGVFETYRAGADQLREKVAVIEGRWIQHERGRDILREDVSERSKRINGAIDGLSERMSRLECWRKFVEGEGPRS